MGMVVLMHAWSLGWSALRVVCLPCLEYCNDEFRQERLDTLKDHLGPSYVSRDEIKQL
jgi:hypothetical protein